MQLKPPASPSRALLPPLAGALVGGALVALLLRPLSHEAPLPPPAAASPLTTAPPLLPASDPPPLPAAASAPLADDPLARAAAGDLDALKRLELSSDRLRPAEQSLAIARGHAVLARRDLDALAQSIARDPALAHDRSTLARLHDFIEREPVSLDALDAVARLPGPESADLLHAVWRRHHHTTVGLLARDLGRGTPARAHASPELLAAIELEELLDARPREGRCEKARTLLERIEDHGDRRCLPLLTQLAAPHGCGADGGTDCYPCLREGDLPKKARAAVTEREPPTPWILPRR